MFLLRRGGRLDNDHDHAFWYTIFVVILKIFLVILNEAKNLRF